MNNKSRKKRPVPSPKGRLRITSLLFALLMMTTLFSSASVFALSEPETMATQEEVENPPADEELSVINPQILAPPAVVLEAVPQDDSHTKSDAGGLQVGSDEAQGESATGQANSYVLTIHYRILDELTQNNTEAAHSYSAQVPEGEHYRIASPEVEGYTPEKETLIGVMGAENAEVSIYYALI